MTTHTLDHVGVASPASVGTLRQAAAAPAAAAPAAALATPAGEPVWFGDPGVPLLGWVHVPPKPSGGSVVLCPPLFGEHASAHFVYRRLAEELAEQGVVAVRFDYPGTGDSGLGPNGRGWVASWVDATDRAIDLARSVATGPTALLGMRMGALLAAVCAARRGDLDALVLWDPCASGRSFLRRQRSLFALRTGAGPDGPVEVPGAELDEAAAADLAAARLPSDPGVGRLLVVSRPGREAEVPHGYRAGAAGAAGSPRRVDTVTVPGGEQEALLEVDPVLRSAPAEGMACCVRWLRGVLAGPQGGAAEAPAGVPWPAAAEGPAARPEPAAIIAGGDAYVSVPLGAVDDPATAGLVRERARWLGSTGLFAIESVPTDPTLVRDRPVVVLVAQGNDRHTGAGRLWVTLARGWAAEGFRCLRVDLSGLGETPARPGEPEQVVRSPVAFDDMAELVASVADHPRHVVLVGLCSSAYQALETAMELDVMGVLAVNPVLRFTPPECWEGGAMSPRRKVCTVRPRWVTALRERLPERLGAVATALRARLRGGRHARHELGWQRQLVRRGVDVTCLCGEAEAGPLLDPQGGEVRTPVSGGCFRLEVVGGLDHSLVAAGDRRVVAERLTARLRDLVAR